MHKRTAILLMVLATLVGCASGPQANASDPLEGWNRTVFGFNEKVDGAVLKPAASAYREAVPAPVRTGVSNFFGNLQDLWSFFNGVLQARPQEAAENFMRFTVNTTLGLGGVLDVASEMSIPKTKLDMGLTLGRWGVDAGPYLVLPLVGSSSLRDGAGMLVDTQGDLVGQGVDDAATRNVLQVTRTLDTRAKLLSATELLDDVALDKYTFVRDAYLQRRQYQLGHETAEGKRYDLDE